METLARNLPIVLYSMPFFAVLMLLEAVVLNRWERRPGATTPTGTAPRGYAKKDTLANLALGVLSMVPGVLISAMSVPVALAAWDHRLLTLGTGWPTWLLAVVAVDLLEYWNHRAGHRIRFLWANHVQHHSSTYLNFSTSIRTPLSSFSNVVFFPWLALFGIEPWIVFAAFSINAVYQLWVHTEAIGVLPRPIEFLFVTPSHHRVHHGSDFEYVDKNFGSVFIVWDRMFGTFQPEGRPVTYGLIHDIGTDNVWKIATHEYLSLFRDVRRAPGLRSKLGLLLMPPGWRPARTSAPLAS